MRKFRLAFPVVLTAFSVITLACASAAPGATPQPTTLPPTPTSAPLPTTLPPTPTTVPAPTNTPFPPTETPLPGGLNQEELQALQAELDANIQKWQQSSVSDYSFQFRVNCFCPTDITSPVKITVKDTNTIESISYVESGEPVTEYLDMYLTVGGMFDMIQEAIDTRVASLTVSYDPQFGYPTKVFIDRDFLMADEERGFEVSDFQPIAAPTLEEIQSSLNANRALWESSGPSDYEMHYRRGCFCPPNITSPVVLSVRNGAIDSLTYEETGQPVGQDVRDLFPDVPGLFEVVQNAIDRDAERIRVSYDPDFGYPVNIAIDYSSMIADEELAYTVSSLQPVQE